MRFDNLNLVKFDELSLIKFDEISVTKIHEVWWACLLAATSSSRSDDVTLFACLSVCLSVTLFFLAVNFAPLHLGTCNWQHM